MAATKILNQCETLLFYVFFLFSSVLNQHLLSGACYTTAIMKILEHV